jgi:DNA repair exonuclease SbcCD ATPase subunit
MITKLTSKNFIGLPDGAYLFGNVNRISGKNGDGKTSLGRAMLFGLSGLTPQLSAAGADYIADIAFTMQIDLETAIGTISCKRSKSARAVTIDKLPVTDAIIEQKLGMPLFAFGCMFWPESFFNLTTQKRRDLFMAITPAQNVESIFRSITENIDPKLIDWSMPQKAIQEAWGKKRLALEREFATLQGQLSEIERNQSGVIQSEGEVQAALAKMQLKLNELRAEEKQFASDISAATKYAFEFDTWDKAWKNHLHVIKENAFRKMQAEKVLDANAYIEEKITVEELLKTTTEIMQTLQQEGASLKKRLDSINQMPETCATCGQKWPAIKPDTTDLEKELETCRSNWEAQKIIEKQIIAKQCAILAQIAKIQKHNVDLGSLEQLDDPVLPRKPDEVKIDHAVIEVNRAAINDVIEQMAALKAQLGQIAEKKQAAIEQQKRHDAVNAQAEKLSNEYKQAQAIEKALHPKIGVWAIALKQKLETVVIPGFKFMFTEMRANGEEIDSFKVVRESDNCSIEDLSSGQKIKFCLALSSLIAQLTETKFRSCFLEHTDLLDAVPAPRGFQVFAERVDKMVAGLSVEIKS